MGKHHRHTGVENKLLESWLKVLWPKIAENGWDQGVVAEMATKQLGIGVVTRHNIRSIPRRLKWGPWPTPRGLKPGKNQEVGKTRSPRVKGEHLAQVLLHRVIDEVRELRRVQHELVELIRDLLS